MVSAIASKNMLTLTLPFSVDPLGRCQFEQLRQCLANGFGRVGVERAGRMSRAIEVRPFIHRSAPFDISLPDDFTQQMVGRQHLAAIGRHSGQRIIDPVAQQRTPPEVTVEDCLERAVMVGDIRPEPDLDLVLRLLLTRDWRAALHRAGAGEPADGLLRGEFPSVADLPLQIRVGDFLPAVFLVAHDAKARNTGLQSCGLGNMARTSSFGTVGALSLQLFSAPLTTSLTSFDTWPLM